MCPFSQTGNNYREGRMSQHPPPQPYTYLFTTQLVESDNWLLTIVTSWIKYVFKASIYG